jgi:hypothetical protein
VRVDPNTGAQKLITDGSKGGFSVPVGVTRGPGNSMYVADEPGNILGTDPGKIWLVNLDTGDQTLVSSNNIYQGFVFDHPQDIIPDGNGNLLVLNGGINGFNGSVMRVNTQTGAQTLLSYFSGLDRGGLDSIEVGRDGTIYIGAISYASVPARIYTVDPVTGSQSIFVEGGLLSQVEGIRFFHPSVAGMPPPAGSGNSPRSGRAIPFMVTRTLDGSTTTGQNIGGSDGSASSGVRASVPGFLECGGSTALWMEAKVVESAPPRSKAVSSHRTPQVCGSGNTQDIELGCNPGPLAYNGAE